MKMNCKVVVGCVLAVLGANAGEVVAASRFLTRASFRHWAVAVDAKSLDFSVECADAPGGDHCVVPDGKTLLPEGWTVTGAPRYGHFVDAVHIEIPVASRERKGVVCVVLDGAQIRVEAPAGSRLAGSLRWGSARPDQVLAVRADKPSEGSAVMSGPCVPDDADALFDVPTDRLLKLEGAAMRYLPGERCYAFRADAAVAFSFRRDFLSRRFDVKWRKPVEGGTFRTPPVGWMTWYAVKFDASEKVVLDNARAFKEKFAGYTDEPPVLWVDWEWGHGRMFNSGDEEEDVTRPRASVYPRGMGPVAAELSAMGFTPALWVSVINDCRTNALWRAHPDWVLGETMRWCGAVWGDPTAPGFCEEYIPHLFSLYKSWGYKAFKWDTMPVSIMMFTVLRDRLHEPSLMPEEVYRKMVSAGRKAIGEKTYLLSCSGESDRCNLAGADVFDAMRVGGDIFSWSSFTKQGVNPILRYQPLHGTLILSDADNLVLRPEFSTLAQARTRVSIYGLAGVPVTVGDAMAALDEPRIELLRRIMPVVPVMPASLARATSPEQNGLMVSEAAFARPWGDWKVKAWSNFDTNASRRVTLSAPGCAVWDYWLDRPLSLAGGDVALEVAPGDTRVVRVTPVTSDAATLISVSRHLSQGGYEMETFRSDASGASGAVKCPGGETVKVTLLLPERHGRIEASHPYDIDGRVLRLKLAPPAKETVAWRVVF